MQKRSLTVHPMLVQFYWEVGLIWGVAFGSIHMVPCDGPENLVVFDNRRDFWLFIDLKGTCSDFGPRTLGARSVVIFR